MSEPLAVFEGRNQAFCANTFCKDTGDAKTTCECPVFNNFGLAPYSSLQKYGNDRDVVISTYDILQGAKQSDPTFCYGKYVDCYGHPCYQNAHDQGTVNCECLIREGPFLTASKSCGPNAEGFLPNGAAIAKSETGIATANSILRIMKAAR